jgi:hypothetical protein
MTSQQQSLRFRVTNGHSADCGTPPQINGDTPGRRFSYFQNEHGKQATFEYNLKTKMG